MQLNSRISEGQLVLPEGLTILRNQGLITLTINRENDKNRITLEVLQAMLKFFECIAKDETAHALVITGAGSDVFSFGLLNPALRSSMSKEEVVSLIRFGNKVFDCIENLPQIVIAAINGKVIAGGAELSLACDIRYASDNATLSFPEAGWGGFPGAGAPVRLPVLIGRARTIELICTGNEITARQLEQWGLVQAVFPKASFMKEINLIAKKISLAGPLAIKGAKKIVNTRLEPGFINASILSQELRHDLEWSEDVAEGMRAHHENRTPKFKGF